MSETRRRRQGDALAILVKLAAGPEGVYAKLAADTLGDTRQGAHSRLGKSRSGLLYKASRRGDVARWFDSPERAKAWTALSPIPVIDRRYEARQATRLASVITPDGVRRTIQAAPPSRFSPDAGYVGPFATLGVGRYLADATPTLAASFFASAT